MKAKREALGIPREIVAESLGVPELWIERIEERNFLPEEEPMALIPVVAAYALWLNALLVLR